MVETAERCREPGSLIDEESCRPRNLSCGTYVNGKRGVSRYIGAFRLPRGSLAESLIQPIEVGPAHDFIGNAFDFARHSFPLLLQTDDQKKSLSRSVGGIASGREPSDNKFNKTHENPRCYGVQPYVSHFPERKNCAISNTF